MLRPERLTSAELKLYEMGQEIGLITTNFTIDYKHTTPVIRISTLSEDAGLTYVRELTETADRYDPFVMGVEDTMCETEVLGALNV